MPENKLAKIDSSLALQLLKDGNRRYVRNEPQGFLNTPETRRMLLQGQFPVAAILGCADSRVPPEIVFDMDIGQLFVVRTAGNVADVVAIGSIEFAVETLAVPLVMVMGHQKCGAVETAISGKKIESNLGAIITEIRLSIENAPEKGKDLSYYEDENIRHTVSKLKTSTLLEKRIADGNLKIIGSKYNIETGEVDFWD